MRIQLNPCGRSILNKRNEYVWWGCLPRGGGQDQQCGLGARTSVQGGYSQWVVCNKKFIVRFPDALPMDAGVPLLCAGITVYSPLKYYGVCMPGIGAHCCIVRVFYCTRREILHGMLMVCTTTHAQGWTSRG
jgi:hypothetical protein